MIRALEAELGVEILVRSGPRIIAVTDRAREIVEHAKPVLQATENLKLAAGESKDATKGILRMATTHMHARYALVGIIKKFAIQYPEVSVDMVVGTPKEIRGLVTAGEVDIGVMVAFFLCSKILRESGRHSSI